MAKILKQKINEFIKLNEQIELTKKKLSELEGQLKGNKLSGSKDFENFQQTAKGVNTEFDKLVTNTNQLTEAQKNLTDAILKEQLKKEKITTTRERIKLKKEEERATRQIGGAYALLSRTLNENRRKYKDLAAQNKENTKEGKALLANIKQQDTALKRIDATVGQHQRSVGNYGKAMGGLSKTLMNVGVQFVSVYALFRTFSNVVKTFMEFEKAQSNLASKLGKTKSEVTELTDQAKMLGSSTEWTASQVTSLQTELAKLGFTMNEIKDSTPGILALASATGTDLADAATIAGAQLRAFGLDAKEMGRVTDVMALSTSKSSLDMDKLQVSLRSVAPVAKLNNKSIEETVAMLGVLSDRGIRAETAGTGLRNMFLENSKAGRTFEEGLSMVANATDKSKMAVELYGKENAVVAVLLSELTDETGKLKNALDQAGGSAQRMADEQLDNLAGSITKMNSAYEGFILSVEEGDGILSKTIRYFVDMTTEILAFAAGTSKANEIMDKAFENFSLWDAPAESISKIRDNVLQLQSEDAAARYFERFGTEGLRNTELVRKATEAWVEQNDDVAGGIYFINGLLDQQNKKLHDTAEAFATGGLEKAFGKTRQELIEIAELESKKAQKEAFEAYKLKNSELKKQLEYLELIKETQQSLSADADPNKLLTTRKEGTNFNLADSLFPDEEEEILPLDKWDAELKEMEAKWKETTDKMKERGQMFGEAIGSVIGNAMTGDKEALKQSLKEMLIMTLRMIKVAAIGQIVPQAFAQPDSVTTFGASGAARVAILTGLVEAGYQAAVIGINQFGEGGSEILRGDRHTNRSLGIHIGGNNFAEDGERFSVFSRRATAAYNDDIVNFTNAINAGRLDDFIMEKQAEFNLGNTEGLLSQIVNNTKQKTREVYKEGKLVKKVRGTTNIYYS